MKFFFVSVMLACLVLPVFSQDANTQRYKSMSDSMGTTVSNSNTRLADFDKRITYNGNGKSYAEFKQKFDTLSKALRDSEIKLNRMINAHDSVGNIKVERDRYESLIKELGSVKSDYDQWLSSVQ
jgi:hypothetical protein